MRTGQTGIFLNGPYGVGKSSVLDHLGDRFADAGAPFSLFDVDWFHRSWPPALDDQQNVKTEARNLQAVWANYRAVGPRTPVIAGVMADRGARDRYENCLGVPLWTVLLTASPDVIEHRLRLRYSGGRHHALAWHLERHRELADNLARCSHDLVVVTDECSASEVADAVFERFTAEQGLR